MVILVYKCLQQWCRQGKVSTMYWAETYCSADVPVSGQLNGPKGILFSSNPFLQSEFLKWCLVCFASSSLVWIRWWELLWDAVLQSCSLIFPLLNLIYIYTIYTPSDNPTQSFSLPGASAPLKFSYAIPMMLFTVVICATYTHCNPFQLFYHFMCFFLFPSKLLTSS